TLKQDTETLKGDTTTLKQDTATLKGDTTTLKQDTTAILGDTSNRIPQRLTTLESEVEAGIKAKILNRPTTVKRGNDISIEFQSASGLSPVLNLYDSANALQVANATMTEIGSTGVYKYTVPVNEIGRASCRERVENSE